MVYLQHLDPQTNTEIEIYLYRNVKNVPELREKIIKGSLQCCILKPSLIIDPFQIVIAANKAAVASKLTTKTIYSEILFNLSMTKNITQGLQKFGIHNKENHIIVVIVSKIGEENDTASILQQIDGECTDIGSLKDLTDLAEIRKVYKLSDAESKDLCVLNSIVSKIAAKEVLH